MMYKFLVNIRFIIILYHQCVALFVCLNAAMFECMHWYNYYNIECRQFVCDIHEQADNEEVFAGVTIVFVIASM